MENPIKMDDSEVPPFMGTSICWVGEGYPDMWEAVRQRTAAESILIPQLGGAKWDAHPSNQKVG